MRGTTEERFWAKVDKAGDCWLWTASTERSYGVFKAFSEGRAHRVSWVITHGPIPDGLHVLHHCDNPPCVRPEHLFLGTHQDNMTDAARKGRMSASRPRLWPRQPQPGEKPIPTMTPAEEAAWIRGMARA